ncbi:MAG TPA: hypothetical protein VFF64_22705 [Candidatus Eremiobacteraceae bacterium]|nr:hypothetical protein [Candidatus Eremiobacteraceae bacterium]
MERLRKVRGAEFLNAVLRLVALSLIVTAMSTASAGQAGAETSPPTDQATAAQDNQDKAAPDDKAVNGLLIEPSDLPVTYPRAPYQVKFHARGNYVPVLHWKLESGALPPGIKLQDDGLLHGEAQRAGEFQFAVSVRDGGQPQQAWQKVFTIKVVEAITVAWKVPAHVNVNRIEGSVEVSNTAVDDMDLTFEVKAVAENGRATEIGYQHFLLTRGTVGMSLPFGETLPYGSYMVYVDVNGEVASRNAIYKEELQTPRRLRVLVGP